jgi:hypothetical protein
LARRISSWSSPPRGVPDGGGRGRTYPGRACPRSSPHPWSAPAAHLSSALPVCGTPQRIPGIEACFIHRSSGGRAPVTRAESVSLNVSEKRRPDRRSQRISQSDFQGASHALKKAARGVASARMTSRSRLVRYVDMRRVSLTLVPPRSRRGIRSDGLSISHACDTICHAPAFLTRSNISTPR